MYLNRTYGLHPPEPIGRCANDKIILTGLPGLPFESISIDKFAGCEYIILGTNGAAENETRQDSFS